MQIAMNVATTRTMLLSAFHAMNTEHPQFVTLNVSRENIVADTLRELSEYVSDDLKKPLRVSDIF